MIKFVDTEGTERTPPIPDGETIHNIDRIGHALANRYQVHIRAISNGTKIRSYDPEPET